MYFGKNYLSYTLGCNPSGEKKIRDFNEDIIAMCRGAKRETAKMSDCMKKGRRRIQNILK